LVLLITRGTSRALLLSGRAWRRCGLFGGGQRVLDGPEQFEAARERQCRFTGGLNSSLDVTICGPADVHHEFQGPHDLSVRLGRRDVASDDPRFSWGLSALA
jgi:hypothetical protein